nr:MAG TPA: hypothetical protein [Caudoviricetes sp.]
MDKKIGFSFFHAHLLKITMTLLYVKNKLNS